MKLENFPARIFDVNLRYEPKKHDLTLNYFLPKRRSRIDSNLKIFVSPNDRPRTRLGSKKRIFLFKTFRALFSDRGGGKYWKRDAILLLQNRCDVTAALGDLTVWVHGSPIYRQARNVSKSIEE